VGFWAVAVGPRHPANRRIPVVPPHGLKSKIGLGFF
jgi:hypothetical protein